MKTTKQIAAIALLLGGLWLAGCNKDNSVIKPEPEPGPPPIEIPVERYSLADIPCYQWSFTDCEGNRSSILSASEEYYYERIECGANVVAINSDAEFERYAVCPRVCCMLSSNSWSSYDERKPPEIDFTEKTLLLTTGVTTSGISGVSGKLQQLSPDEYKLNVEITLNRAPVVEHWVLPLLTDKLSEESRIEVNVTEIEDPFPQEAIVGTWKQIGYVNPNEAIDYAWPSVRGCYCLQFSSDKTVFGTTSANYLSGNYEVGEQNSIQIASEVENLENELSEKLDLKRVKFYAVSGDELKLYCDWSTRSTLPVSDYYLFKKCNEEIKLLTGRIPATIDWENYNSVPSVCQNWCSPEIFDCNKEGNTGKTLKIAGWVYDEPTETGCTLAPKWNSYISGGPYRYSIRFATPKIGEQIEKMYNESLGYYPPIPATGEKMCLATGELHISPPTGDSPSYYSYILITDPDDIIFE